MRFIIAGLAGLLGIMGCSDEGSVTSNQVPPVMHQDPNAEPFKVSLDNPPGFGLYTMPVLVAGQTFHAQIDTGSSNMLLLGGPTVCPDCMKSTYFAPEEGTFTPAVGQTPLNEGKTYTIQYGIGGGDFVLYSEQVALTRTDPAFSYPVGVFVSGDKINNILGLGYAQNAVGPTGYPTFWDALRQAEQLPNIFAMNLCSDSSDKSYIYFGQYEKSAVSKWTPLVPLQTSKGDLFVHYVIEPTTLTTAGRKILFPTQEAGYAVVVDTGTSLLMLSSDMIAQIAQAYPDISPDFWDMDILSDRSGPITVLTQAGFDMLKPFDIQLPDTKGGAFIASISPSNYTRAVQDPATGEMVYASNISSIAPQQGNRFAFMIFGDVFLTQKYVVINNEQNQLGLGNNDKLCL